MVFAMGLLIAGSSVMLTGCTKEGPQGLAGKDGTNGTNGSNGKDGKDGTAGCITCHSPASIEAIAVQYEHAKHAFGLAAFDEAGRGDCAPCHESEGFKFVVTTSAPSTFTLNAATGKYVNGYTVSDLSKTIGDINCSTCHNSIHSTYTAADLPKLTTVKAVAMTMWGGTKTIDLAADEHIGNLCVTCHQPRPITKATDGNVLDYAALVTSPATVIYDAAQAAALNIVKPSYRTGIHYGASGAIYAGKGGVEFPGAAYTNSVHTAAAACQNCHMAAMNGSAGGHTFIAKGNFAGCNVAGCHSTAVLDANSSKFKDTRANVMTKLNNLAAKLKIGAVEIMSRNPDATSNLWFGLTTNNYDGYLNLYDPYSNPTGIANNPGGTFQNPSPSSSWTQAQKDINTALPKLTLTNAQLGAIINFQLCLRDNSLGIHNTSYTNALLDNSIAILP